MTNFFNSWSKAIRETFNEEPTVTKIEVWYDKQFSTWVVQRKDKAGNQIGDCEYINPKKAAVEYAKEEIKKHPNAELVIFKRDGSL